MSDLTRAAEILDDKAEIIPQAVCAFRYGVDQTLISQVRRRKVWAHVE